MRKPSVKCLIALKLFKESVETKIENALLHTHAPINNNVGY